MDQDRHLKLRVAIQDILRSVERLEDTDPGPSSHGRLIRGAATGPRQVSRTRLRRWIPSALLLFVVGTMAFFGWRVSLKHTGETLAPPEVRAHVSLKSVAPGVSSPPVEPLAAPEEIVSTSSSAPLEPEKLRAYSEEPEQTTGGEPAQLASETPGVSALALAERSPESPPVTLPSDAGNTKTTALAKSVPAARSGLNGGFFVQMAAHRSKEHAQAHVKVMQSKYPAILGSREPIIYRKDLGSKGIYWRTQLGPFASRKDATKSCNDLKAAGGQCLVQRKDQN